MALTLYAGRPGSGKSYSVVEYVVIPALKKGRHVVTNIPLRVEDLCAVYGGEITQLPLDCLDDPSLPDLFPHGAVCIIDECWHRWPSGQKVSNASKQDLHWLKEHRHRVDSSGNAMQVVLVTQNPSDLASWVRNLIAHSFHMCKLEEIGQSKRFSIKVYKGCPTGDRIPAKHLVRESIGTYKPDIYQFYSSATQSQTDEVGDEKVLDRRTNIWASGSMIAIVCFVAFAFVVGPWLGFDYVEDKLEPAEAQAQAIPETVPEPVQLTNPPPPEVVYSQPVVQAKTPTPDSTSWRIAGYIKWNSSVDVEFPTMPPQALLAGPGGSTRYFPLSDCEPFPDGIDYACIVDGERVTPWSGLPSGIAQGLGQSVSTQQAVQTVKSSI